MVIRLLSVPLRSMVEMVVVEIVATLAEGTTTTIKVVGRGIISGITTIRISREVVTTKATTTTMGTTRISCRMLVLLIPLQSCLLILQYISSMLQRPAM